jgi:hypothetical protein
MTSRIVGVVVLVVALLLPGSALAQFGHPLKGQWSGEWGPKESPKRLLLDLQWDGKVFTGAVNPGDENAKILSVVLDYSNVTAWKVRIEAEGKDASGKPLKIVAEGTLENIGAYYKVLHGTWTEGSQKGDFTVTRN